MYVQEDSGFQRAKTLGAVSAALPLLAFNASRARGRIDPVVDSLKEVDLRLYDIAQKSSQMQAKKSSLQTTILKMHACVKIGLRSPFWRYQAYGWEHKFRDSEELDTCVPTQVLDCFAKCACVCC